MDEDEEYAEDSGGLRTVFRSFVCLCLVMLLGIHVYNYMYTPEVHDGDFSDIKYVLMQLTRGLSEVSRKHENLKVEMERISSELPAMASTANRAKEVVQLHRKCCKLDNTEYDKQIVDYALETAGARIIDTGDTLDHKVYESPVSHLLFLISTFLCRECVNAKAILRPGNMPGECWAFKGSKGEVTIRLVGTVAITGISIEHIPPHVAPTGEISSAPRMFRLEGLETKNDMNPHNFGLFQYDRDGKPIQYFEVLEPASKYYNLVRIKILNNWGHPVYTCVYRVRIHGELAPGQVKQLVYEDEEDYNPQIDIE